MFLRALCSSVSLFRSYKTHSLLPPPSISAQSRTSRVAPISIAASYTGTTERFVCSTRLSLATTDMCYLYRNVCGAGVRAHRTSVNQGAAGSLGDSPSALLCMYVKDLQLTVSVIYREATDNGLTSSQESFDCSSCIDYQEGLQ